MIDGGGVGRGGMLKRMILDIMRMIMMMETMMIMTMMEAIMKGMLKILKRKIGKLLVEICALMKLYSFSGPGSIQLSTTTCMMKKEQFLCVKALHLSMIAGEEGGGSTMINIICTLSVVISLSLTSF